MHSGILPFSYFPFSTEGKESFSRSLSMPASSIAMDLSSSSTQFPEQNNNLSESPKPDLRECGVQTPDVSSGNKMEIDTQTEDEIPVKDTEKDLERTQSSKSVATCSTTSSGEDTEKRHSIHSSTHSFDSTNSREDIEKKYFLATSSSGSGDYINANAAASDSEIIMKDNSNQTWIFAWTTDEVMFFLTELSNNDLKQIG